MNQVLQSVLNVFKFHKKKIAFFFGSIIFWVLVLFPYDDLSDFVSQQVTQNTQGNLYLQCDKLGLTLMPQLGVKLSDTIVEGQAMPTLKLDSLSLALSTFSLIKMGMKGFQNPDISDISGKAIAEGVFKGNLTANISSSNVLDTEGPEKEIALSLEQVAVDELTKTLKKQFPMPVKIKGTADLNSTLNVDMSFKQQPKGDVSFIISKFEIPSSNVSLGSGLSMSFPSIKLSNIVIDGNLNDGKFFIKEGKIGDGSKKDELYGQITGDLFFEIQKSGRVKMGGYDLKINLNIKENLKRQLGTVLGFIDFYKGIGSKYKFDSLGSVRYSMRLTARNMKEAPRVSSY